MQNAFKKNISICYNGMKINSVVHFKNNKITSIFVTNPTALKGMVVKFNGKKISVNYQGLSYEFDKNDLPKTAFCIVLAKAVDKINSQENMNLIKSNKPFTFKFDTKYGKAIIKTNRNSY